MRMALALSLVRGEAESDCCGSVSAAVQRRRIGRVPLPDPGVVRPGSERQTQYEQLSTLAVARWESPESRENAYFAAQRRTRSGTYCKCKLKWPETEGRSARPEKQREVALISPLSRIRRVDADSPSGPG